MIDLGVPGEALMGRAGVAVAEKAKNLLVEKGGKSVAIICGKGNNGGDGYAAAARLRNLDVDITILSTLSKDGISGDARIYHDHCEGHGLLVQYEVTTDDVDLSNYDLVIDALLGTGVKGQVRPDAAKWIDSINMSGSTVLAVDIPSGISSDSGQILGKTVRADATVTMGFLKQGLIMNPGAGMVGDLVVAEIGYPEQAFDLLQLKKELIEESLAEKYLIKPPAHTYKHRQGKVLILAGSRGYTGAGCLACEGAFRAGAGLVIAGVPESINAVYETKLTEVITAPVPDGGTGRYPSDALDYFEPQLDWCHVVAVGPGIGREPDVQQFARTLFETVSRPFVIDADALRVFHDNLDLFKSMKSEFIITPHYGEASALFGVNRQDIVDNPFDFAHESARKIGGVVVLKGAPTLVADGETVMANTTGHQGLATGGSGDVLTGVIAAFLAQGLSATVAAQLAVFVHGKAADSLLESHGYRGMISGDLPGALPGVISAYEHS